MVKACHQAVAIRFFELCTLSLYFGVELMGHAKNKDQKYKALLSFPVILSAGSHPFPSRTRKLSLLEPMVLRGKLRGRVGSRRDYFNKSPRERLRSRGLCSFMRPGFWRADMCPAQFGPRCSADSRS